MRVLLSGAAGSLGTSLSRRMRGGADELVGLDILPCPATWSGEYVQGSITDRSTIEDLMAQSIDAVVHIAAYHGVHEHAVLEGQTTKDAYDFWNLNVAGTFQIFEAAARAGVRSMVYISSTSIPREKYGLYGHSKILGEQIASTYAHRHNMRVITLRPRGFIPPSDRTVYRNWLDWAKYFWKGAVHVDDVAQSVECALARLGKPEWEFVEPPVCAIDGKIDYTADQLANWDADGEGSTFTSVYGSDNLQLARSHGLDPSKAPRPIVKLPEHTHDAGELLGYSPTYSIRDLLEELRLHGPDGQLLPDQPDRKSVV